MVIRGIVYYCVANIKQHLASAFRHVSPRKTTAKDRCVCDFTCSASPVILSSAPQFVAILMANSQTETRTAIRHVGVYV